MVSRNSKKPIKIKVAEVSISSALRLFQYEGKPGGGVSREYRSNGGSTGSEVILKLHFPDGVPEDDMRGIVLRQKWELDHTLLEMEHARGSLTTKEFQERTSELEEMYLALLDPDEYEDDDEDED